MGDCGVFTDDRPTTHFTESQKEQSVCESVFGIHQSAAGHDRAALIKGITLHLIGSPNGLVLV